MGFVYRYIDKADNIIKYIGIVYGERRSLSDRIYDHSLESKFQGHDWKIEYITEDIDTRTDAEYFESHFISLYGTDKYLNISKKGWGISKFLPERADWKEITNDDVDKKQIYIGSDIYKRMQSKIEDLISTTNYLEDEIKVLKSEADAWRKNAEDERKLFEYKMKNLYSRMSKTNQYHPAINLNLQHPTDKPTYENTNPKVVKNFRGCTAILYKGCIEIDKRHFACLKQLSETLDIPMYQIQIAFYPINEERGFRIIWDDEKNFEWLASNKYREDQVNILIIRDEKNR